MSGKNPETFVIFASGVGSNADAVLSHAQKNPDLIRPVGMITDRQKIGAIEIANRFQVPTSVVSGEAALLAVLNEWNPKWALLLGYKKLLSPAVLDFFNDTELNLNRVLNVHPSLLPAYPGLGGYKRAFADGVRITGVTVHFVDAGLDTGVPLLQESFRREASDSFDTFLEKAKGIEHALVKQSLEIISRAKICACASAKDKFIQWENQK